VFDFTMKLFEFMFEEMKRLYLLSFNEVNVNYLFLFDGKVF
jgi:hypothetical protein